MTISAVCAKETHFSRSRSTGKERDAESGLDYFGARYYASNMGRFMSPDWSGEEEPVPYAKLENPQTLNLYAYANNNPVTGVDPDGHMEHGFFQRFGCSEDEDCLGNGTQTWLEANAPRVALANTEEESVGSGGANPASLSLSDKSTAAVEASASLYHFNAKNFEASAILAGLHSGVDPNLLVGLAHKESTINPYAGHGGLFQLQPALRKQLGISVAEVHKFQIQLPKVAGALSGAIEMFGGNVDLGIASWTLGTGGTQRAYRSGGMEAVRARLLSRRHPEYGTVGPNYIDPIKSFE
jgi:RHS repeat-associated protein